MKAKSPRRYKVTTDSRYSYPLAANLLDCKSDVSQPKSVWTADITYIWTFEGWSYLAVVMDLYSRQIVGWAMDKQMKNSLRWMPWRWPTGAENRLSVSDYFTIRIVEASTRVMNIKNFSGSVA